MTPSRRAPAPRGSASPELSPTGCHAQLAGSRGPRRDSHSVRSFGRGARRLGLAALAIASVTACVPATAPAPLQAQASPGPTAAAEPAPAPADAPGPVLAQAAAAPPMPAAAQADAAAGAVDDGAVDRAVDEVGADAEPSPEAEAAPELKKVLILGDSLVATGFGAILEKQLDAHEGVVCYRRAKSASGLARPDFFDWMGESKRQVELRQPDLVVVVIGGNDGQDLAPLSGKGKRVRWPSEDWNAAYRGRVDEFLAGVRAPGRKVVWLALPPMGLGSLERKLETIRAIQREAVEALGGEGTYVDTAPWLADADGKMLTEAVVEGKARKQVIRADDGIHFTMAGSQYFADHVFPEVLGVLGVPATPTAQGEQAAKGG